MMEERQWAELDEVFSRGTRRPGNAARKRETNGWSFWRVRKDGELVKLSELRK